MAQIKQALVPDIGDYSDVPVIELLVQVGDRVSKDQGLATLESDKATMEVPAPFAGVVREIKVKLGDAVSEGALVAMIEVDGDAQAAPAATVAPAAAKTEAPAKAEPPAAKPEPAKPTASETRSPPVAFSAEIGRANVG